MKPDATFSATIEKNWIMRCIIVPGSVMRQLGGGARIPVIAIYCGEKVETTVMPAGRGRGRLTVLVSVLRPAGLEVGDRLEVALTRATDSREPVVPADLQRALQFRPAARAEFADGPTSQRRWVVKFIEEAKQAETRHTRIETAVDRLAERKQKRRPSVRGHASRGRAGHPIRESVAQTTAPIAERPERPT